MARSLKAIVSPWKSSRIDSPSFSRAILNTSGTEKPVKASPTRTGTGRKKENHLLFAAWLLLFWISKDIYLNYLSHFLLDVFYKLLLKEYTNCQAFGSCPGFPVKQFLCLESHDAASGSYFRHSPVTLTTISFYSSRLYTVCNPFLEHLWISNDINITPAHPPGPVWG